MHCRQFRSSSSASMVFYYLYGQQTCAEDEHLVRSPNARLKPAELERGAVFRDGAAMSYV